jgi:hypothetical protein
MTHAHTVAGRLALTHSAQGHGRRLAEAVAARTGAVLRALAKGAGRGVTVREVFEGK